MKKSLIITFRALIIVFIFILSEFFVPIISEFFKGSLLFLLPFVVFSLLGILLVFLTLKQNIQGKPRKYLLLTGIPAISFFIFIFLHNIFYALAEISSNVTILKYLMKFLEGIFFIIAILVCPLIFLIGAMGSIIIFIKIRKKV